MKRILFLIYMAVLPLAVFISGLGAQTKFELPVRSPDYASYLYFEDCFAAARRISSLPEIQAAVVDTFLKERSAKYNSISQIAKDTGLLCSNKWLANSIPSNEFIKRWAGAFMMLGRRSEVRAVFARRIDSLPIAEKLNAKHELMGLFAQYKEKETIDEWLEISESFFKDIPQDSFALVVSALGSQVVNWVGLWEPQKADSVLNEYLKFIDSIPPAKRKEPIITNLIAPRFFATAELVKEPDALMNLSKSTADYSNYLHDLWFKVGNSNPRVLPIDSTLPNILGKWWYVPKSGGRRPFSATKLSDESVVRPVSGKVNVIAFMEPGCHTSSPKASNNQFLRKNGEGSGACIMTLPALNRLKELYPEIQITIVSRTFGSMGSTLSASPESEAEVMAKYIIEHWKVDATVAVEETEFFRLPGEDRRRIDLPTRNDANFNIANRSLSRNGSVILVDPDGKIFYTGSIIADNEVGVRNMVGAVLKRNQSQTVQK